MHNLLHFKGFERTRRMSSTRKKKSTIEENENLNRYGNRVFGLKNPKMSGPILMILGLIVIWIIANLKSPTSFNEIFTFLIVIPILGLLPGLSLTACLMCVATIKDNSPNNQSTSVKITHLIALTLHLLAIIFFIKTIPIFFS
jgi:hypothetical protein